jgi:hypothetical protein
MQRAIQPLRCLRAETGSNYPLAGKCVNHFILRVLINSNWAKGKEFFVAHASACGFLFLAHPKNQMPKG